MDTVVFTICMLACAYAAFWLTIDVESTPEAEENLAIVTVKLIGVLIALGTACISAWLVLNSLHPIH